MVYKMGTSSANGFGKLVYFFFSFFFLGLPDCVRKIYKTEGLFGLFNGFRGTLYRDMVGFPVYFCTFELLCRLVSQKGPPYEDLGPLSLIVTGGFSGALSWTCAFPHDAIKCRLQVDYSGKYSSFSDCFRQSFKEEGWQLFQRGLVPCVIRGFPMNAAIFSIYMMMIRVYEEKRFGEQFSMYLTNNI